MACHPVFTRSLHLALMFGLSAATSPDLARAQTQSVPRDPTTAVVRPGDRVRLKVWREPDLSGEFVVDEKGIVVLPMVGYLQVRELSIDSLETLLVTRYSASLRNPAVEITVLRRVNVLGAVRNPGLYLVDLTTTVTDVLALAGGISSEGDHNRIELRRGGARQPIRISLESRLTDSRIQSGDQLWVAKQSWFARNTGLLAAGITATALIVTALIR